jgi:hypothetical protein
MLTIKVLDEVFLQNGMYLFVRRPLSIFKIWANEIKKHAFNLLKIN